VEYPELERRLGALGASVSDRLQDQQRQFFAELLDAGEYGKSVLAAEEALANQPKDLKAHLIRSMGLRGLSMRYRVCVDGRSRDEKGKA